MTNTDYTELEEQLRWYSLKVAQAPPEICGKAAEAIAELVAERNELRVERDHQKLRADAGVALVNHVDSLIRARINELSALKETALEIQRKHDGG